MIENDLPTPEEPQYRREQIVDSFRIFPKRGITNPDDLPLNDTDVISANAFLQVWANQQLAKVRLAGTDEADIEYSLNRSTIYFDAGFSHPDYLDEVAHELLDQDLQRAEEAGLVEISNKIKAKIGEIESKLESSS